jgi:hypothetical protein
MWAFLKATLMPGLIVGIGVRYLYHTIFPSLPPFRVRRTRCYHTRCRMDRRRVRSNICQRNDRMTKGSTDWASTSDEPQNDGPQSLDNACIHAFAKSIDPLKALRKIKQVAVLAMPVIRQRKPQRHTYRQAFLSEDVLTGNAVSTTASVYCSHKEDRVPIVIDTGASVSVTPVLTDSIGPLRPCATANLKGLSGSTEVIGEGTVNWLVRDMFGNKRKIRTTAHYVPEASIRLFYPHTYFKEKKAGSLLITHERTTLTLKDGSRMDFPYQ